MFQVAMDPDNTMRQLRPHWNAGMIAASIAISFLGAFTSTQLFVPHHEISLLATRKLTSVLVCARPECPFIFQVYSSGPY